MARWLGATIGQESSRLSPRHARSNTAALCRPLPANPRQARHEIKVERELVVRTVVLTAPSTLRNVKIMRATHSLTEFMNNAS